MPGMELSELVDSLPGAPDKIARLGELKIVLESSSTSVLKDVVPNVSFDLVFDCLNSENEEQINLCCDVLLRLMSAMEPTSLLHNFHSQLLEGFSHPAIPVKKLSLNQVLRVTEASCQQVADHTDVLLKVVLMLGEDSLEVAAKATKVLQKIGTSTEGMDALFQNAVLRQIKAVMDSGDTVRFRVYDVMVHIASQSPECLSICDQSGLLQRLVNEVHKDDILVQLTCLEMLKDLALQPHGLDYLEQHGVVRHLEEMLTRLDEDPLITFLLPGLVKFFGSVAYLHPKEIFSRFQSFINLIFDLFDGQDLSLKAIAMETVGLIGSTADGKLALEKQGSRMDEAVKKMGRASMELTSELRLKTIKAMRNLLILRVPEQTAELLSLTESWFSKLFPQPVNKLLEIADLPFTDMRCAAFEIFTAIADQPWGQRVFNNHPGFKEYLLNRSTEKSKEGKEAKFQTVKTLAESPTALDIFDAPYHMKLRVYVNEGPYYVRTEAAVAMEEAS